MISQRDYFPSPVEQMQDSLYLERQNQFSQRQRGHVQQVRSPRHDLYERQMRGDQQFVNSSQYAGQGQFVGQVQPMMIPEQQQLYQQQQWPPHQELIDSRRIQMTPMISTQPFLDRPYGTVSMIAENNNWRIMNNQYQDQLIDDAVREQMYVMERDFDFQIRRILKLQQEEIEEKEGEIDALRNDNYIKSDRNMRIFRDFENWSKILNELQPDNEVSRQMKTAVEILEPDIEDNYTEEHPLLAELDSELEYLARENADLYERRKKIERMLYMEESKRNFLLTDLPSNEQLQKDRIFYPQWSDRNLYVNQSLQGISENQNKNHIALERCKLLATIEYKKQFDSQNLNLNSVRKSPDFLKSPNSDLHVKQ